MLVLPFPLSHRDVLYIPFILKCHLFPQNPTECACCELRKHQFGSSGGLIERFLSKLDLNLLDIICFPRKKNDLNSKKLLILSSSEQSESCTKHPGWDSGSSPRGIFLFPASAGGKGFVCLQDSLFFHVHYSSIWKQTTPFCSKVLSPLHFLPPERK